MSSSPSTANTVVWYETVPPRVLLALALTALVSVLVFAVSELAFSEISTNRIEGRRAVQAQAYVLRVREQLLAAESSQRGYLITHLVYLSKQMN